MTDRRLLGMLTPSSNTVLEPVTAAMLAGLPDVTAHFGRFRVTEISLGERALDQFDARPMLAAAELLADARVANICWNGTSAGWLGFEADRRLCAAISERTGVPACSSVLALNEIFERTGVRRFALVTPYVPEVQQAIVANYAAAGFECVAERHLGERDNFAFSTYDEALLAGLCREVAAAKPDAITIFCTNLRGAPVAARMEQELGIPIYDTIATGVWKSLLLAGVAPARVRGWGRLFAELA
ncbi:MAG TPA: aspartate/glutamate racemase family protein [Geminicoccaceae bacterium]|nr:aspartate/glutamate racemase family protein [Geminicoccaceae bacterium]